MNETYRKFPAIIDSTVSHGLNLGFIYFLRQTFFLLFGGCHGFSERGQRLRNRASKAHHVWGPGTLEAPDGE